MEIISNQLFKVDIKENKISRPKFKESDNLDAYLNEILNTVSLEEGDREYKFQDGSKTISSSLLKIIDHTELDLTCETIAKRLLEKEIDAQKKIVHLKKEIQKGILIIAHIKILDEKKIIISKADYDEFIEDISGDLRSGLPIKKKIFKAFIVNISDDSKFLKLVTFDNNTKVASYWWKEFLELTVVRDDEENTKNAFSAIEMKILNPIKKKFKQDYLHLWNATIAYFRGDNEFDMAYYTNEIIGNYKPFNVELDIYDLTKKCNKLSSQNSFDNKFTKVPSAVKSRFKNVINLTNEIDLHIKHDVANVSKTFKPYEDADGKYLMIRSDAGYEYAKNNEDK